MLTLCGLCIIELEYLTILQMSADISSKALPSLRSEGIKKFQIKENGYYYIPAKISKSLEAKKFWQIFCFWFGSFLRAKCNRNDVFLVTLNFSLYLRKLNFFFGTVKN